jgi:tRNA (cmo5U34)-methyltransferase
MTQESIHSDARWGEEDSQDFIDYGNYFIPDRETQIDVICSLIPPIPGTQHILDLCCGEGILTRALLDRFPGYYVHGFDGSAKMIERVQTLLAGYGEHFASRLFDLAGKDWRELPWPVHAVVSSLAIHHLDAAQKQDLFRGIFAMLAPGGVFIIADLIQPVTQLSTDLSGKMWDEAVRERSLHLDGNLVGYEHFLKIKWNSFVYPEQDPDPMDKMSPLFDQLKWLEQAGFADVDVFWVKAGHAIFGGRKNVAGPDRHTS